MYELVGIQRLDFTGNDGNKVQGWNFWFTEPATIGYGLRPFKQFANDVAADALLQEHGGFQNIEKYMGSRCHLQFNRYGRVDRIEFVD